MQARLGGREPRRKASGQRRAPRPPPPHQLRLGALSHVRQVCDVEEAVAVVEGRHFGVGVVRKAGCGWGGGGRARARGWAGRAIPQLPVLQKQHGRPSCCIVPTHAWEGLSSMLKCSPACRRHVPATAAGLLSCQTICCLTAAATTPPMNPCSGAAPRPSSAARASVRAPARSQARPGSILEARRACGDRVHFRGVLGAACSGRKGPSWTQLSWLHCLLQSAGRGDRCS